MLGMAWMQGPWIFCKCVCVWVHLWTSSRSQLRTFSCLKIIFIFFCGSALSWKIWNCRNERLFIGSRYIFMSLDPVSILFSLRFGTKKRRGDILSPMDERWKRWNENFIHFCARVFVLIAIKYRNEWRVDGHGTHIQRLCIQFIEQWAFGSARAMSASVNGKSHLIWTSINPLIFLFVLPTREACRGFVLNCNLSDVELLNLRFCLSLRTVLENAF